jgi:preprotein translocase subunit SecF
VLQLLKQPNFDYMKRGKLLMGISALLVLASVVTLFTRGLNLGIEFTGGTELQLKYVATPDVGEIRSALNEAGLTSQVVTTIGDPSQNEIYIRLGASDAAGDQDLTSLVARTLRGTAAVDGLVDLNVADEATIERLLAVVPDVAPADAAAAAAVISDARKDVAIFASVDDISGLPGLTPAMLDHIRTSAEFGPLAVRSQSYVGPAIGEELMDKARLAITLSLLMMLIYIWIRFQLQWGFAAVLALTHDTLITLGLFSLFQKEMSLPVVAAFLTLVGYSVNDTVVVFDRIRENLHTRAGSSLAETVNLSINQTLSRTVITSVLTWVVVFGLYVYGGAALNPFAFVLCVGVVVGTYSSIYIASPFLVLWKEFLDRRDATAKPAAKISRQTRKVPTGSSGRS